MDWGNLETERRRVRNRWLRKALVPHVEWWNGELVSKYGLTRSRYDYKLFYSSDKKGDMDFLLAYPVDKYVYTGMDTSMEGFDSFLFAIFEIGTFTLVSCSVMGWTITQQEELSIVVSHAQALSERNSQLIIGAAGTAGDDTATLAQANVYLHVIGKMLYIGQMSAPIIFVHASMASSKLTDLRFHHLRSLASVIKQIQTKGVKLQFLSPPRNTSSTFVLDILSDGASPAANDMKRHGI